MRTKTIALFLLAFAALSCTQCDRVDSPQPRESDPITVKCTIDWEIDRAHFQSFRLLHHSGRIRTYSPPGKFDQVIFAGTEWNQVGPFKDGDTIYSIDGCGMEVMFQYRADRVASGVKDGRKTKFEFVQAASREPLLKLAADWPIDMERDGHRTTITIQKLVEAADASDQ